MVRSNKHIYFIIALLVAIVIFGTVFITRSESFQSEFPALNSRFSLFDDSEINSAPSQPQPQPQSEPEPDLTSMNFLPPVLVRPPPPRPAMQVRAPPPPPTAYVPPPTSYQQPPPPPPPSTQGPAPLIDKSTPTKQTVSQPVVSSPTTSSSKTGSTIRPSLVAKKPSSLFSSNEYRPSVLGTATQQVSPSTKLSNKTILDYKNEIAVIDSKLENRTISKLNFNSLVKRRLLLESQLKENNVIVKGPSSYVLKRLMSEL